MAWMEVVERLPLRWIFIIISLTFHSLKLTQASVSFTSNIADTAVNEFSSHERVIPLFYYQDSPIDSTYLHDEHLKDITIVISSARKNFTLDLKINGDLLSSKYVKRRPHSNGYHIHKPSDIGLHKQVHCYYHGHIRGFPHSMAAVSTCEGISGFWSDEHEFYHLEPSTDKKQFVHLMYRDSDRKPMNYSCGYHQKHDLSPSEQTRSIMKRVKRDLYGPYDSNDDSRYVELFLVSDYRLAKARSVDKLEHRSKEITNIVSRLYRPLNIYVALVGVEVWDQTNQVIITSDPNTTLDNFLRYRRERINPIYPNDNAQLLTGERFKDGVVGKAVKGPICTYQYSGGVNMDYSSLVSSVATTVAHEMGHNFGMQHDDDSCICPQDRCIMASISGSASPTMWSSCSKQAVADAFRQGMDYCLRNKPKKLFGASMCGNGFLEEGEECDCGLPEACDNKCCNATTCRLTPSSLCATGKCCDRSTCRPLPEATVCRKAKGICDLAEYCNGTTEFCPGDVSVQNGQPCKDGAAYCYDGKCSTHTDQCQVLWGPSGKMSDDLCYRKLNIEGKNIGNCGFNWIWSTYARCKPQDVLCGMLHCVHLNEKLMFWKDIYAESLPATFLETTNGNRKYVCRGAVLDVGLNMPNPGMVPNGAKCGEAKMCVNQRCISLSSLGTGQICSSRCNDHGVCNSKGNCHCDAGYAPPLCAESGYGCSVDSGPCRLGLDKRGLLAGLLILFFVVIPLIIILIVAYWKRDQIQQWWKKQSFFKYRVPSIGKPPPQPSVSTSPSVNPASSTRENKFRNVSFRTGNPPSISNPVLKSSTNRNSQALAGNVHSMETFKPPDDSPIYNNVPPPRPPPPRPKSFNEDTVPEVEFAGARTSVNRNSSLRAPTQPPPPPQKLPLKPPQNRQRDIQQLQDNPADKKYKFENSRLALKPTGSAANRAHPVSPTSRSPPATAATDDTVVSALKAKFDGGNSTATGRTGRGKAMKAGRGGAGDTAETSHSGRGGTRTADQSANRGTVTRGRGRGRGGAGSFTSETHTPVSHGLSQSRPSPPPKPPKADKTVRR